MSEVETPVLDAITVGDWMDLSDQEKWEEYERRKQAIKKLNLSSWEYELRVMALVRELGI